MQDRGKPVDQIGSFRTSSLPGNLVVHFYGPDNQEITTLTYNRDRPENNVILFPQWGPGAQAVPAGAATPAATVLHSYPAMPGSITTVKPSPDGRILLVGDNRGDAMLFDVRGEAVCPTCGARYHRRTLNVIALVQ